MERKRATSLAWIMQKCDGEGRGNTWELMQKSVRRKLVELVRSLIPDSLTV